MLDRAAARTVRREARVLAHAAFGLMNSTPFLGGEVDRERRADLLRAAALAALLRLDPQRSPHSAVDADAVQATDVSPTGREARMIESLLVANRGRDRPPDHPHRPAAGHPDRSRSTPRPTRSCRSSPRPTRRCSIGPANPAQSYRNAEAILAAAKATGAAGDPPRLRVPVRERRLRPGGRRRNGLIWVGPAPRRSRRWATRSMPGT